MKYQNQIFYLTGQVPVKEEHRVTPVGEQTALVALACFGESISAITCDFPKGYTWDPHAHLHEQLCVCLSGALEYTINGQTAVLHAGDTAYLPPNAVHVATALEDTKIIDIFTPVRMDQMAWYDPEIHAESAFIDLEKK